MLDRLGHRGSTMSDTQLIRTFDAQVAGVEKWMFEAPNVQCIHVEYTDALSDPAATMHEVNRFLGRSLDEREMVAVIDPTMRRQDSSG